MTGRSRYNSHVGLWRIEQAKSKAEELQAMAIARGPNPRVEAYVKEQMQEHFERLNEKMGYSS